MLKVDPKNVRIDIKNLGNGRYAAQCYYLVEDAQNPALSKPDYYEEELQGVNLVKMDEIFNYLLTKIKNKEGI